MACGASEIRHELHAARDAWSAGDWLGTGERAKKTLAAAVTARDSHGEAQACLLLASVLSLESRFAWARTFATRAQALFAKHHDATGFTDSMLALSYVDGALGDDVLSAQAAEQALAGAGRVPARGAAGLNYRGVAACWAGDYGTARGVLDAACHLAREETGSQAAAFHPLSNAVFTEVLRCATGRMARHRVDFSELGRLLYEQEQMLRAGAIGTLTGGSPDPALLLYEFASCFAASRTGDAGLADRHYLACLERAARLPGTSWMWSLVWWARLERTLAAGTVHDAAASVQRLVATAAAGEHAPMKKLAARLAAEAQGCLHA
ncbi:MAG TPA: hypothetical protein VFM98_13285 [Ramlibacter sp.]|uniref:hypothetical protein n=1 Tax=Ramlibacter sp. TaxID=1917967 RepID=UPI002D7E6811|nr:hypothetical protein [Ramlibacter sp.]HET8746574.1 hypothetical protein [Ramlibacter sp.]